MNYFREYAAKTRAKRKREMDRLRKTHGNGCSCRTCECALSGHLCVVYGCRNYLTPREFGGGSGMCADHGRWLESNGLVECGNGCHIAITETCPK